jgi:hypothetical protein
VAKQDDKVVRQIIKRHGEVINLRENPAVIIEIIRQFGRVFDEDGGLPGGVPPSPPPGPTSIQGSISNEELMREILKLQRAVSRITKQISAPPKG